MPGSFVGLGRVGPTNLLWSRVGVLRCRKRGLSGFSGFKVSTFTRKPSRFDLYPAGLFGYPAAAAGSHASAREYLRKELELGTGRDVKEE